MKSYPSYLVGQNTGSHKSTIHKLLQILLNEKKKIKGDADILLACREPDNPHDDRAVAIYLRDPNYKLGYLPQKHHWVADALDEGSEVLALISEIRREGLFTKKYFVDLELIPMRATRTKMKKKVSAKKSRDESDAVAKWPEFRIAVTLEQNDHDILVNKKGKLSSRAVAITLDASLRAKDSKQAIQKWARKYRRTLEKWWDENDKNELFHKLTIYRLDAEIKGEATLVSLSDEDLEDAIEDGLDSSLEI